MSLPVPIFEHEILFEPERAAEVLRGVAAGAGVVSLFGHAPTDRPFILQSANLRRRLQRLLMPAEGPTKRLNLRDRIARIAWRETHSQMEAMLLLYRAMSVAFGVEEARRKMRLSPPFTVRYAVENRFPRIYVTNHLRRRSLHTTFGPFASRRDAEQYRESVEELFVIRRCFMELHPSPEDPGCIYGEMKKCMAPCQARCSEAEYGSEAARVLRFLETRGGSLVAELEEERDRASGEMLFEEAAAAHVRVTKAKSVGAIVDGLVGPLDAMRVVLLVPCPPSSAAAGEEVGPCVQVFLFADGCLRGPEPVSLLGVRLAKEQVEVGSSLFAQPMMLAAVPLEGAGPSSSEAQVVEHAGLPEASEPTLPNQPPSASSGQAPSASSRRAFSPSLGLAGHPVSAAGTAEERMLAAIGRLEGLPGAEDVSVLGDQLALLRRWYYRPEKQREGVLFQQEKESWPVRKMVRAAAKLAMAAPARPDVARDPEAATAVGGATNAAGAAGAAGMEGATDAG